MTDEQINQSIAKALNADEHWMLQKNYCTDLNAMHEAEKTLIKGFEDEPESSELWSDYQTNLIIACKAYLSYHATARQRAEAFLKTLGKWEEGE
jgi:hypothetical protein